ncbi:unnamed protein product [Closterium sp. NIES-53]
MGSRFHSVSDSTRHVFCYLPLSLSLSPYPSPSPSPTLSLSFSPSLPLVFRPVQRCDRRATSGALTPHLPPAAGTPIQQANATNANATSSDGSGAGAGAGTNDPRRNVNCASSNEGKSSNGKGNDEGKGSAGESDNEEVEEKAREGVVFVKAGVSPCWLHAHNARTFGSSWPLLCCALASKRLLVLVASFSVSPILDLHTLSSPVAPLHSLSSHCSPSTPSPPHCCSYPPSQSLPLSLSPYLSPSLPISLPHSLSLSLSPSLHQLVDSQLITSTPTCSRSHTLPSFPSLPVFLPPSLCPVKE